MWLVGRTHAQDWWEVMGIFETEAEAEQACRSPLDFIGPVPFGVLLPEETTDWPQCRYPLAEEST